MNTPSLARILPGMAQKRLKRPRDPLALAKLIGDIATEQKLDRVEDSRNPHAVALGQRGGLSGGKARAQQLSPRRRKEIAKLAAAARWKRDESE